MLIAPPATAAVVDERDARGDVFIPNPTPKHEPTPKTLRQTDLWRIQVVKRKRVARFVFTVKRFTEPSPHYVQVLWVELTGVRADGVGVGGLIQTEVRRSATAFADAYAEEHGHRGCAGLTSTFLRKRGVARIDVPYRCLPAGRLSVRATSFMVSGDEHPGSHLYSTDELEVPRKANLGGRFKGTA